MNRWEVIDDGKKVKKELIEVQNTADQIVYAAEKALKEHGEKVSEDIRTNVQAKIDTLKAARTGSDADAIKRASEELSTAMSAIGEAMQKAQGEQKPPEVGRWPGGGQIGPDVAILSVLAYVSRRLPG